MVVALTSAEKVVAEQRFPEALAIARGLAFRGGRNPADADIAATDGLIAAARSCPAAVEFRRWLYVCVRNAARRRTRRRLERPYSDLADPDTSPAFEECCPVMTEPAAESDRQDVADRVEQLLRQLSLTARSVLEYRFGLIDGRGRTLDELAALFGTTASVVGRVERQAIERLRGCAA